MGHSHVRLEWWHEPRPPGDVDALYTPVLVGSCAGVEPSAGGGYGGSDGEEGVVGVAGVDGEGVVDSLLDVTPGNVVETRGYCFEVVICVQDDQEKIGGNHSLTFKKS